MKYTTVITLALFSLAACHNADTNTRRQPATASTTDSATRRSALIKALQELRQAIVSKDKHRIAAYFQFPIPDSIVEFYSQDSTFTEAKSKEGGLTTETFYNNWFDKFSPAMALEDFDTLFQRIDIHRLLQKDTLKFDGKRNDQPCYKFYSIDLEGDSLVTFMYGNTVNVDVLKAMQDTTAQDGRGDFSCGGGIFWVFLFDGRRLRVSNHGSLD